MRRNIGSLLQITTTLLGLSFGACATPESTTMEKLSAAGCTVDDSPRACDPADTKKTTVCHIPPGNPDNAHTICVGNAAVPAHLAHGDFVGTCDCPGSDVDAAPTEDVDAAVVIDAAPNPPPDVDGGVVIP